MKRMICAVALASGLSGCSGIESMQRWDMRNGPKPEIDANAVADSIDKQIAIMNALEQSVTVTGQRLSYYSVTVAGFNYIDEQCDAYLREIYLLDHGRDRLKGAITASASATEIILSVAKASHASIGAAAAAFNLSSQLLDTEANSYLYSAHAASVVRVVDEMQSAYRQAAKANAPGIQTRADAYASIRGYLRLCMPPTIESQINNLVGSVKAAPDKKGSINLTAAVTEKQI